MLLLYDCTIAKDIIIVAADCMRVTAKKRGLQHVSDLCDRVKGCEAAVLSTVVALDVSGNEIATLLVKFDASGESTVLSTVLSPLVPPQSSSSSSLAAFTSLASLDLHRNALGRSRLLGLSAVHQTLTWLSVADNQLESIEGIELCVNLTYLDVSRNRLKRLDGLPVLGASTDRTSSNDRNDTSENGGFVLKAAGNLMQGTAQLIEALRDTVGARLSWIDVSFNKLDVTPVLLMTAFSSDAFAASKWVREGSCVKPAPRSTKAMRVGGATLFPRLRQAAVDCNPFLINASFEGCCTAFAAAVYESGLLSEKELLDAASRSETCCALWGFLNATASSAVEGSPIQLSASGRSIHEEADWKAKLTKKLSHLVARQSRSSYSTTETSSVVSAESSSSEILAPHNSDPPSALRVDGVGTASCYPAHLNSVAPLVTSAEACAKADQLSSDDDCISSNRVRLGALPSSRDPSHRGSADALNINSRSTSLSFTSGTVDPDNPQQWQDERYFRVQDSRLLRDLEDHKRLVREQLSTIRKMREDEEQQSAYIRDLEDRLKRKTTEANCLLRRAHDAEAACSALREREMLSHTMSMLEETNPSSAATPSSRLRQDSSLLSFAEGRGERAARLEAPLYHRRTFHLSESDRSHLADERALSRVSHSYDKDGRLLHGRYSHAHRSYVYSNDLPQPLQEQHQYNRIALKHKIESEVAQARKKIDRIVLPTGNSSGAVLRDVGPGAAAFASSLSPQEEAILFLSDRVAQLEAMRKEQEAYCDDLARENDDLMTRYEKLALSLSANECRATNES